jgi:hypothetical protein
MEVETHFQVSGRLPYLDQSSLEVALGKTGEVGRMLNGLIQALTRKMS